MKKALLCALMGAAMLCCGSALHAQMQPGPAGQHRPGKPMTTEDRLARLTQYLNLTDDQQQKIRPILDIETKQMDALHQDTTLTGQDRWSKVQTIRDTTTSQIKPILNPDQLKKYEEMTARHPAPPAGAGQGPGMGQGAGPDQGQAPPPPPPQ
jgi:protein CpxP